MFYRLVLLPRAWSKRRGICSKVELPTCYGTRSSIPVSTRSRHWTGLKPFRTLVLFLKTHFQYHVPVCAQNALQVSRLKLYMRISLLCILNVSSTSSLITLIIRVFGEESKLWNSWFSSYSWYSDVQNNQVCFDLRFFYGGGCIGYGLTGCDSV
jgi:hypothetical protein